MQVLSSKYRVPVALAAWMLITPVAAKIARAQESPEVAVVSIAPLDGTLSDISYLLEACNVPEVGGLVNLMTMQYTRGVDTSKPIGAKVVLGRWKSERHCVHADDQR